MAEKISAQKKTQIVDVTSNKAVCDGQGADYHPKVYLILENGQAVCPYCSCVFKQK